MSIKTLSTLSLSIITVSLLSACGGGSSENTTEVPTDSNNPPVTAVEDNDSPTLALKGPDPQFMALGASFVDQNATATDAIDGDLTSSISESNNVNTAVAGCYKQTYLVSDNASNLSTISRTVLVGTDAERHSPNTAPITQEVSFTNIYNSTTTVNLLDSASDSDCDSLTVSNITAPDIGTVQMNADGTITYDSLGVVGSHYFTYTVSDAYGGSSTSGASISSVDPDDGNDDWPDVIGDNVTTAKNTAIVIDVLANDFDGDGDVLILDGVDTPKHGTTQKQNGKVLYTPDLNYVGEDSFYYGVHDDHGHNGSALVVITITE